MQFSTDKAAGNRRTDTRENRAREGDARNLWGIFAQPWSRAGLYMCKVRQGEMKKKASDTELEVK